MKKQKPKRPVDDIDSPPVTAAMFRKMRPAHEVFPELVRAAKRGRPRLEAPKELVTLRLDADVLSHFRNKSGAWRADINSALRKVAHLKKRA